MYEQIFHHWRKGEVLLRGNGAASTRPTGAGGRKRIKIAQKVSRAAQHGGEPVAGRVATKPCPLSSDF